ncbi:DNA adenine methylase [Rhodovulum sulfidophilum]|nr:DNA adenine methylase [Rhodovulum sulfidophilum]
MNEIRRNRSLYRGKKAFHRQFIEMIDAIPHRTYVEPFLGIGGVFLRRA